MGNKSGNAYGLTLLCPIRNDEYGRSFGDITRDRLEALPLDEDSPMSKVPNTYLCRFYVLDDVPYQGYPANEEHLKSRYLVFCTNFYGDLDTYLKAMWNSVKADVQYIWENCVAFEKVKTAEDFAAYCRKCQVTNNLFFNGSNDDSLQDQLKALYIKQEFSRFIFNNHGRSAAEIQDAFKKFIAITQPENAANPTWCAGMTQEHPHHNYENSL